MNSNSNVVALLVVLGIVASLITWVSLVAALIAHATYHFRAAGEVKRRQRRV